MSSLLFFSLGITMKNVEKIPLIDTTLTKNNINNTKVTLTWSEINVTCRENLTVVDRLRRIVQPKPNQERILLNKISGIARSGEILAILGSSGAGKTTLLNVLSGQDDPRTTVTTGHVAINGHLIPRSKRSNGLVIGHVEQREVFIETLSLEEHLTFQVYSHFFSVSQSY
jgi:ABC-type polysaccharide/polyol phosphate transport system ATPase subunit